MYTLALKIYLFQASSKNYRCAQEEKRQKKGAKKTKENPQQTNMTKDHNIENH